MTEYGRLIEEKVRLQIRQGQLAKTARQDFQFRMQAESWESEDLKTTVLGRLDERVSERMDENRELAIRLAENRAARKAWHHEALTHVHNIVCPACSNLPSAEVQRREG